jgi:dTDP-4-dehydrorhamnose 3,5-epimerase
MTNFKFENTHINNLETVTRSPVQDSRGNFDKLFCEADFSRYNKNISISQINLSRTNKLGTLRGLHYQKFPFLEKKIVSCVRGKIFDVVIDIRQDSPTFLKHYSIILSSESDKSVLIPEGFAHGFQSLEDNCEVLYMHTNTYQPDYEAGLNCFDPKLKIDWPLPVSNISKRDSEFENLTSDFLGIPTHEM